MFKGLGMLQVYNVTCVFIINHDAESAVELRHGDGGGGAHRVSSSRVAYLYFGAVLVFHSRTLFFIAFVHGFLCLIGQTTYVFLTQKHVLPLDCIFFN